MQEGAGLDRGPAWINAHPLCSRNSSVECWEPFYLSSTNELNHCCYCSDHPPISTSPRLYFYLVPQQSEREETSSRHLLSPDRRRLQAHRSLERKYPRFPFSCPSLSARWAAGGTVTFLRGSATPGAPERDAGASLTPRHRRPAPALRSDAPR